eukprot:6665990-Alexandrium_andersonii.AAC.1
MVLEREEVEGKMKLEDKEEEGADKGVGDDGLDTRGKEPPVLCVERAGASGVGGAAHLSVGF